MSNKKQKAGAQDAEITTISMTTKAVAAGAKPSGMQNISAAANDVGRRSYTSPNDIEVEIDHD